MIVSCIQLSSGENYKHNLKKYLHFVKKSINKNADLILTPEMTSIMTDEKNKLLKNSYTMEGDLFIKETKFLCRKFKRWILIGSLPIKEKKRLKNRSILINPDGKIICYYDKINMFDVNGGNWTKKNLAHELYFLEDVKDLERISNDIQDNLDILRNIIE